MNSELHENDDRIVILDDEETEENSIRQNDMHVAIANTKPKKHFVEPVLFFLFAAFSLYETVVPNTIEIQFCRAVLNVSEAHCLNTTTENLVKLQKFTSMFQLARSIIEVTIPAVISFFVGPWSDTYGRKPLILSATIGYALTYGLWTLGSTFPTLDPIYFLIFSIPLAFSGGSTIMILGTFCYVCDVTTLENRGARLGRLQASLFVGSLIGTQLCPLLVPYGYTVIFGIATACVYIALVYAYCCIDESIVPSQIELNSVNKNPFHMEHVRGLFDACYTKQSAKVRFTIFLFIAALGCSLTNTFGESGVMYLFLQNVLGWDLAQYTTLSSFIIIVNAVGAYGGAWLLSYKLKLDDLLILSLAAFFRVLSALVMIFGYKVWHIYFSKFLACTLGLSGPLIRSFLSRIVAKDELGKVFSLLASTESMTPLFASLTYTSLYEMTLSTFPGAIFYVSAFLMLAMLGIYTVMVEMYAPKITLDAANKKRSTVSSVTSNRPSINVS